MENLDEWANATQYGERENEHFTEYMDSSRAEHDRNGVLKSWASCNAGEIEEMLLSIHSTAGVLKAALSLRDDLIRDLNDAAEAWKESNPR